MCGRDILVLIHAFYPCDEIKANFNLLTIKKSIKDEEQKVFVSRGNLNVCHNQLLGS